MERFIPESSIPPEPDLLIALYIKAKFTDFTGVVVARRRGLDVVYWGDPRRHVLIKTIHHHASRRKDMSQNNE